MFESPSFNINPGKYWVGDPLYIIPEEDYAEWESRLPDMDVDGVVYNISIGMGKNSVLVPTSSNRLEATGDRYFTIKSGRIALINYEWAPDLKGRNGNRLLIDLNTSATMYIKDNVLYIADTFFVYLEGASHED